MWAYLNMRFCKTQHRDRVDSCAKQLLNHSVVNWTVSLRPESTVGRIWAGSLLVATTGLCQHWPHKHYGDGQRESLTDACGPLDLDLVRSRTSMAMCVALASTFMKPHCTSTTAKCAGFSAATFQHRPAPAWPVCRPRSGLNSCSQLSGGMREIAGVCVLTAGRALVWGKSTDSGAKLSSMD